MDELKLILASGVLALVMLTVVAREDSCSWGWLQHGATVAISALIGMAMAAAACSIDRE
jgi:hypothetical protein